MSEFPAQFARASLKLVNKVLAEQSAAAISRAICAGLIEAFTDLEHTSFGKEFPAQFARASLKLEGLAGCGGLRWANFPRNLRGPH